LKQDPALHQWASTFVGAAAANTVGGDAQTGGSTAASGTKNNWYADEGEIDPLTFLMTGGLVYLDSLLGLKGKDFRGGSQRDRDKWYGYNDKEFQRWWHREGKADSGGNDIDNSEDAKNAYDDWVSSGKPTLK